MNVHLGPRGGGDGLHQELKGREDRDEAYFEQFASKHVAWSRTVWDVATIAWLKNPGWCASSLMPAVVLRDDCTYGPVDRRHHSIRVVNYCQRDLIFGDLVACLDHDEGWQYRRRG